MNTYRENYMCCEADATTSTFSSCAVLNVSDAMLLASFLLCAVLVLPVVVVVAVIIVITSLRIMHIIRENADFKMKSIA